MALSEEAVDALLAELNGPEAGTARSDGLMIVRAHGYPAAVAAELTSLDEHGATWHVVEPHAESAVRVSWPSGPLHRAADVRREVRALAAADRAGPGLPGE